MKRIKQNLKFAARILSFLILLQSCTVYHKYSSSADEAVQASDKVKLYVVDDDPYKFKNMQVYENEYYGLAKINSETYRRLSDREKLESDNEKFSYVRLNEEELKEIHLKNIKASKTLTIVIPIVGFLALIGIGAIIAAENCCGIEGTFTVSGY